MIILLPFVKNPELWNKEQIIPHENDGPLFLGFAALDMNNQEYKKLFNRIQPGDYSEKDHKQIDPLKFLLHMSTELLLNL